MRSSGSIIVISFIVFSIISSYFVFRFGITPDMWIVSVIFMMLFAAPSVISLWIASKKHATLAIITLSIFSLAIESIAIKTGFPYGSFYYGGGLGPKILGLAPLMVPFAWVPLVIGCYSVVSRYLKDWRIIPTVSMLLVIVDLVLDPGAYALRVWIWTSPGFFYGVPFQNFVGWFLSGTIGATILHLLFQNHFGRVHKNLAELSLVLTLCFWTGIVLLYQMWIPGSIGIVILAIYYRLFHKRSLK